LSNLGHDNVLTTFAKYRQASVGRQPEIIRDLAKPRIGADETTERLRLIRELTVNALPKRATSEVET
jgi:hypothetical protein